MNRFNVRVYAVIINDRDEVLVADENRYGRAFTKFPGGGLEWGEGLKEGLQRELREELGLHTEIGDLLYINDFFQTSAFRDTDQILSVYYHISQIAFNNVPVTDHEVPLNEEGEKFRWIPRSALAEDMLTFPIDKVVSELIRNLG